MRYLRLGNLPTSSIAALLSEMLRLDAANADEPGRSDRTAHERQSL